ncbi:Os04g0631900 [Oryza sativa Japonica Group]|uniref:Os04g0631900 protein n=1 Tax=Oryza sativa subsp. japonica TaxID=39947 RepID=A0A0P0WFD9_ORYSJ|nr:Os04g0631900 [Oryza sativa Japonica Group]
MNFAAQYGYGQAQIDSEAMVYDPIHVRGPNPSAASRRSFSVRQPVQPAARRRRRRRRAHSLPTMPARRCLLVPPLQPPSPTATTGASSGDSRHVPFDGALLLPPPPGTSHHSRRPSTARFPRRPKVRFSRLRRELKPMVTW